jgi:hypothetical protein
MEHYARQLNTSAGLYTTWKKRPVNTTAGMHPVNIGKRILTDTEIKTTAREEAARANKLDRGARNIADTRQAFALF